jgi:hypothetical protein
MKKMYFVLAIFALFTFSLSAEEQTFAWYSRFEKLPSHEVIKGDHLNLAEGEGLGINIQRVSYPAWCYIFQSGADGKFALINHSQLDIGRSYSFTPASFSGQSSFYVILDAEKQPEIDRLIAAYEAGGQNASPAELLSAVKKYQETVAKAEAGKKQDVSPGAISSAPTVALAQRGPAENAKGRRRGRLAGWTRHYGENRYALILKVN